jgi:hypothetical protein
MRAAVFSLAGILSVTGAVCAQELVGKVVPPFPSGMYDGGGACIGPPEASCDRKVSVLISVDGKKIGVYAAKFAGRDGKSALWTVTDLIPYPQVPKGRALVWSVCRYDKAEDPAIVAVVGSSKQQYLAAAGWTYRVDERSGKLTKLDSKRVDCFNTALEAD